MDNNSGGDMVEEFIKQMERASKEKDLKEYLELFEHPLEINRFNPFISEKLIIASLTKVTPALYWEVDKIIEEGDNAVIFLNCHATISNALMVIIEVIRLRKIHETWKIDLTLFQLDEELSLDANNIN